MRILLSYAAQYDKGEGIHFARVLRRLGHCVRTVNVTTEINSSVEQDHSVSGFSAGVPIEKTLQQLGAADLFLYVEPQGLIPQGLERAPIPTACVLSDMHRNLKARQTLALLFDNVFLYQCNYLKAFNEHPSNSVHWWPWACDTELFRDTGRPRDVDVAFVGQLFGPRSERRRILGRLEKQVRLNEQRYYLQNEIPECYSRAKIVVNIPLAEDLNCRVFEAMSCGAMLITRRDTAGQDLLFKEGTHYIGYSSENELLEKVSYFLGHDAERKEIAAAGYRKVVEKHSLTHRLQELLQKVESGAKQTAPVRHFDRARLLSTYAAVYERAGYVETLLNLAGKERSNLRNRIKLTSAALRSVGRRVMLAW